MDNFIVYCPSFKKAVSYFCFIMGYDKNYSKCRVKEKLLEGSLKIGPPPSRKGHKIIEENGRFYHRWVD